MSLARSLVVALLCLLPLTGCGSTGFNPGTMVKTFVWDLKKRMRKPGQKLVATPDALQKDLNCDAQPKPFIKLQRVEMLPPQVKAGKEVNHRFVYALCPQAPAQISRGTLTRRVMFDGQAVFEDVTENFALSPGSWSVDVFITIPANAPPGVYSFECSFNGRPQFKDTQTFVVVN